MPDKLVWVAKDNRWNSNRTRDIADVSFTVTKETSDTHAELLVRSTYYVDPKARAVWAIGRMYFRTSKDAKRVAEYYVNAYRNDATLSSKKSARDFLLENLLSSSYAAFHKIGATAGYPEGFINIEGTQKLARNVVGKSVLLGSAASHGYPSSITYTSLITAGIRKASDAYEDPSTAVVSMGDYVDLSMMVKSVEVEVKPAFDPNNWRKGDPVPEGYIEMGKKIVPLEWPK